MKSRLRTQQLKVLQWKCQGSSSQHHPLITAHFVRYEESQLHDSIYQLHVKLLGADKSTVISEHTVNPTEDRSAYSHTWKEVSYYVLYYITVICLDWRGGISMVFLHVSFLACRCHMCSLAMDLGWDMSISCTASRTCSWLSSPPQHSLTAQWFSNQPKPAPRLNITKNFNAVHCCSHSQFNHHDLHIFVLNLVIAFNTFCIVTVFLSRFWYIFQINLSIL